MKKAVLLILAITFILWTAAASSGTEEGIHSCKHKWILKSTKPATCTKAGSEKYVCELCGKTKKVKLAALGHEWGRCEKIREASCTEPGLIRCYCSRDESHIKEETLPALGHDWSGWHYQQKETLTEKGAKTRKCERCGTIERKQTDPLIRHEDYELILFLSMMTETGGKEDGQPDINECALYNTGKEDLWIRSYSTVAENEAIQTEERSLPAGKVIRIPISKDLFRGMTDLTEEISQGLSFIGETKDGKQMCVSKTVIVTGDLFSEADDEIVLDQLKVVSFNANK